MVHAAPEDGTGDGLGQIQGKEPHAMKPSLQALRRPDEGPHRPAHVLQARGGRGRHDSADRQLAVAAGGGDYLPASHNHFSLTRAAAQTATLAPPAEGIDTSRGTRLPRLELPAGGRAGQHQPASTRSTARTSTTRRSPATTSRSWRTSTSPTSRWTWPMPTRPRSPAGSSPAGSTTTKPGGTSTTPAASSTKASASR